MGIIMKLVYFVKTAIDSSYFIYTCGYCWDM